MKIKSNYFKKQYDLSKAELIGEGNFAQVYRIFDQDLNDSLAIRKVKKNEADLEDISKEKVINEELRKVDNENILKIFDIIDEADAVWYITEYCSGGSLWDVLNLCKDNRMNEKEGLMCVLQISKGVQELHNHRITHRDLKPENILLKTKYISGKPMPLIKLADFGLSTQKIIMETIAGTKEYIAPEQAKFHNYTNAVDVWSLGIISDQILHGNPFYSGENNKEVFSKILKMPFRVRDQSLRSSVKEFLVSLLKKKPYERPIIAVIRKTIEKILEEIELEQLMKTEEKGKKIKSSNHLNESARSIENSSIEELNSKQSNLRTLGLQSRRLNDVAAHSVESEKIKQDQHLTSIPSYFKREANTPMNRSRPFLGPVEAEIEKQIQVTDNPMANSREREKASEKQVTTIHDIREREKIETEELGKLEEVFQFAKQSNVVKSEKNEKQVIRVDSSNSAKLNEKITIYKIDRKKLVNNNLRKEEVKSDLMEVKLYIERIFTLKRNLVEKCFRLEKDHSFIPNAYLNNQSLDKTFNTDQTLKKFHKKYDFLNFFATNDDYEIKLIQGENHLAKSKQLCLEELLSCESKLKSWFFGQIDNYIDAYVQKNVK